MFIISPLSACASIEKRDEFLSHLQKIAATTYANEPNCHAYAWFRSAGDNTTVPAHWLRGFEVYATIEANQVSHRASAEYKAFRSAVSENKLLERPSDLRFWRSGGIGFLSKEKNDVFQQDEERCELQYLLTDEFVASSEEGAKEQLYSHLRALADSAKNQADVLTFWVLDRGGDYERYAGAEDADAVYVLIRCRTENAFETFCRRHQGTWEQISQYAEERRRTSWVEAGIGFFAR